MIRRKALFRVMGKTQVKTVQVTPLVAMCLEHAFKIGA